MLFTTASAESNCCTNGGDNNSALHNLLSYVFWYQKELSNQSSCRKLQRLVFSGICAPLFSSHNRAKHQPHLSRHQIHSRCWTATSQVLGYRHASSRSRTEVLFQLFSNPNDAKIPRPSSRLHSQDPCPGNCSKLLKYLGESCGLLAGAKHRIRRPSALSSALTRDYLSSGDQAGSEA